MLFLVSVDIMNFAVRKNINLFIGEIFGEVLTLI